jgi:protein TonB
VPIEERRDLAFQVPKVDPDLHLRRLLVQQDLDAPLYASIIQTIKELIHPPGLPPLVLTSKLVDSAELKGVSGLYDENETRAGIVSLLIHSCVVALLLYIGSIKPARKTMKEVVTLVAPPLLPVKPIESKGGGGGSARQPMVKKADVPKPTPRQFVPPRVDAAQIRLEAPVLLVADPPDIVPASVGNLTGLNALNGSGYGGGVGIGSGSGIGSGKGEGFGSGINGGTGGGVYRPGGDVTKPLATYRPEPEYSDEARRQKRQGAVLLSLVVDENGKPVQIKVLRSLGLGLDEKAIEAVQQWRFQPGKKSGRPVPVQAQIEVTFRLL